MSNDKWVDKAKEVVRNSPHLSGNDKTEIISHLNKLEPAQHPEQGDAIEALKLCQPFMEDLQFENHNEPGAGITYDYNLEKAIRALYKCLGIETFPPSQPAGEQPPAVEGELRSIAEYYFHNHKQTFRGVNAGDYIDKEDWDKFFDALASQPPPPLPVEQDELWKEAGETIVGYMKQKAQLIHLSKKLSSKYILIKK